MRVSALTHFCSTDKCPRATSASRGFTLIETAVAIAIISIIITSVYGIFSSISATKQRLESEADGYTQARVIFSRIGQELRTSYLNTNNELSDFVANGSIGSDGYNDDSNYLEFTSTSALLNTGEQSTMPVRIRYQLERNTDSTICRLLRSAVPLFDLSTEPTYQRLSSQIKQLQWRFYDGSDWQESWDSSSSNQLPQTVEMSLILQSGEQEVQVLSAFDLALSRVK
ncbi:MAG: type II secretion system protein GspJ [Desulfuromonas sp.]|nr:type II secretion system protein GspJ [Desulfuromonas sp.]